MPPYVSNKRNTRFIYKVQMFFICCFSVCACVSCASLNIVAWLLTFERMSHSAFSFQRSCYTCKILSHWVSTASRTLAGREDWWPPARSVAGWRSMGRNNIDFWVILHPLHNFCLWSVHTRVTFVEHIFHFGFGTWPFFIWADRQWSKPVFSSESSEQKN